MSGAGCDVPAAERARAVAAYTVLHEGLAPAGCRGVRWAPPRGRPLDWGTAVEIQYEKRVPDGAPDYWHPWAGHARPTLLVFPGGRLAFAAGRYVTTGRGIEDRARPDVEPEAFPKPQNPLLALGRLRFVRYKSHDGRTKKLPGSPADLLCHDRAGNLYVLQGVERAMAHPNPAALAHAQDEATMKLLKMFAVTGLVATATGVALALGMQRLAPASLDGNMRGAIKIAAGLGGGYLLAKYAPEGHSEMYSSLAYGVGLGGVVAGMSDLYQLNLAARVNALVLPAAPTGRGMLPAGQIAGMPAGFQAFTAQACGAAR